MDATAQELLDRFARNANRGVLGANDWEMFDAFVGHVIVSRRAPGRRDARRGAQGARMVGRSGAGHGGRL